MTSVSITGIALTSACGADVAQAVAYARSGVGKPSEYTIPTVDGQRTIPYFTAPALIGVDATTAVARVCRAALADAGNTTADDLPLFIGSSSLHISEAEAGDGRLRGDMSTVARRVKTALGLRGADYTFNTACTSSAHALLAAHTLLRAGRHRAALVVGIELANRTTAAGFKAMQLLGSSARPFDGARDGLVLGEAIGAVVLSTTPHSGHVRLLGGANAIDTTSPAGADPSGQSLAQLIRCALDRAGIGATDIGLIKAQAAGSPINDAAEAQALADVFRPLPRVTSVKGYFGHLLGACGCAELALLLGCWREGFTPSTAGCHVSDPTLPLAPLTQEWVGVPRYALLNYLGFGGGQAALVVENRT
jgi:3-oxoacyl-[acyl-carrier-protein] synthase-1